MGQSHTWIALLITLTLTFSACLIPDTVNAWAGPHQMRWYRI